MINSPCFSAICSLSSLPAHVLFNEIISTLTLLALFLIYWNNAQSLFRQKEKDPKSLHWILGEAAMCLRSKVVGWFPGPKWLTATQWVHILHGVNR